MRNPRLAITPEALRAAKTWAAIDSVDPGLLVSRVFLAHIPARIRAAMTTGGKSPKARAAELQEARGTEARSPEEPRAAELQAAEGPRAKRKLKRPLSEDPAALAKLEELRAQEARPSLREIAKIVGYSKSSIERYLRKVEE
jgi:uncharacterized membrane protein